MPPSFHLESCCCTPSRSRGTGGDGERGHIGPFLPEPVLLPFGLTLTQHIPFPLEMSFSRCFSFSYDFLDLEGCFLYFSVLMVMTDSLLSPIPGRAGVRLQLPAGGPVGQNPSQFPYWLTPCLRAHNSSKAPSSIPDLGLTGSQDSSTLLLSLPPKQSVRLPFRVPPGKS